MSAKDNYNKAFSKGAKGRTNFLVFGVLAVAIAGAAAFVSKKGGGPSDASAAVMRAPEGTSAVTDANKASDVYLNTLKDSNKQEIAKAEQSGTSAVATLTAKAVKIDDGKEQAPAPTTVIVAQPEQANLGGGGSLPPVPQFASPQGGYVAVGQPGVGYGAGQPQPTGMQQNKALSGQVAELLDTWKAPGQAIYVARNENQNGAAATAAAAANAQAAAQTTQTAAAQPDQVKAVLIPAGKVLSAVIDTQTVSDDGGPVLATIVSGPYNGAKLLGAMTVTRDAGKLTFNSMSFRGATASISAVAVDPDSGRVGMADDVDKHWFEKYGLVFLASFVGGYGEAAGSVGTTVTQSTGSTVVQQDPMSPRLRTQVALGKSGAAVAQQFAQDAQQIKTTITLNQARPIGVMFLKDVTSQ